MTKFTSAEQVRIKKILHEDFALCACGQDSYDVVLRLLKLYNEKRSLYDEFKDTPESDWADFAAKILTRFNLTEHGGSVNFSWLTPDGHLILRFLEEHGTNSAFPGPHDTSEKVWPDWFWQT